EAALELGEVLRHRPVRALGPRRLDLRHAGQLADAVDRGHGEAVPAVAPRPAGTVLRIEVHDAHAAATLQMVRGGEPGLAGSDHDDVRAAHLGLHARHNAGTREMFPPGEGSHAAVVTSL